MSHYLYYDTKDTNPVHNLALEEYLLLEVSRKYEKFYGLYFWQNDNTIVVGRNQDIQTECNLDKVRQYHTKMVRRLTGGGAVYHDMGNLNFSILTPLLEYDKSRSLGVIMKTLNRLGFDVSFSGRNDLLLQGRKFSGNAYYKSKTMGLHHGTILVNSNHTRMKELLHVSSNKLSSKGIASVEARVINLSDINSEISMKDIKKAVREEFEQEYKVSDEIPFSRETYDKDPVYLNLIQKYGSDSQWTYGAFEHSIQGTEKAGHFSWGECLMRVEIEEEVISKCQVYSDSLNPEIIEDFIKAVTGTKTCEFTNIRLSQTDDAVRQMEDMRGLLLEIISHETGKKRMEHV